ncbi:MAG: hypothetical protein M3Y72_14265 [Acidobacteriota bacterium]|nr:hypothetical protein [Acidobacteriota bacterium]
MTAAHARNAVGRTSRSLCGLVEFAVPYTDAWITAHRLNTVLHSAAQLKAGGNAARLFLPTRPGLLLSGERTRVQIVAAGNAPLRDVVLHTRLHGSKPWNNTPAALVGRQTYEAFVGPFEKAGELASYYASASIAGDAHTAPAGAP